MHGDALVNAILASQPIKDIKITISKLINAKDNVNFDYNYNKK